MNIRIGRIFKTVTMRLMTAASRTPRAMSVWNTHTPIEATITASSVSPSPNSGKNAPIVAVTMTQ